MEKCPRPSPIDEEWELFVNALGHNLHKIRIDQGLTQETVAARSGVSRYTYQRLERGRATRGAVANPSMRNILAIAQALEVDWNQLIPPTMPDLRTR